MGEIKWCPKCEKNIRTVKPVDWLVVVLLLPFWLFYALWYIGCKRPECPFCHEEDLHPWKTEIEKVWDGKEGIRARAKGTLVREGDMLVWKPES